MSYKFWVKIQTAMVEGGFSVWCGSSPHPPHPPPPLDALAEMKLGGSHKEIKKRWEASMIFFVGMVIVVCKSVFQQGILSTSSTLQVPYSVKRGYGE